ncbi:MAG: translation initiation factor [Sulfurovum sp.]|nr:MAG: translation initiation factor [Sulfurovum sp.]
MKKNLFEMGADLGEGWQANNKTKETKSEKSEIKAPQAHRLYLAKEKRRGKVVTIIKPFALDKQTSQALLKAIKKRLGCGGTFKEDNLELQGDIANRVRQYLQDQGYRFR